MILPGLVSISFRDLKPEEIIPVVRRSGLHGIEWGGDVHVPHGSIRTAREVRRQTQEAGLAVAAYGSYYAFQEALGERDTPPFEAILETAVALDAPLIRVWAGRRGSGETPAAEREAIVARARAIGDMAASQGKVIAFEYHGGTLSDTSQSAVSFLEEIGHPSLRSLWQPPVGMDFNQQLEGLRAMLPHLENLHVFHWGAGGERLHLEQGRANWSRFLTLANVGGAARYALLEFVPGDSLDTLDQEARTLRDLLSSLPSAG